MTRLSHTRAEIAFLPDRILVCLKREPMWTVQELSAELGFAPTGIRNKLLELEMLGLVHHLESRTHGGLGLVHYWNNGPKPKDVKYFERSQSQAAKVRREAKAKSPQAEETDSCPPRQNTVKSYPQNFQRDPLVAALFGPAQREAA